MLTLKPALTAAAVALAVIAAQALTIRYLYDKTQQLDTRLLEQSRSLNEARSRADQTAAAYAAYRSAAEQMQAQLAEQQRQHRADMQRLADALAANRQWAQTELPPDIQTALNPQKEKQP